MADDGRVPQSRTDSSATDDTPEAPSNARIPVVCEPTVIARYPRPRTAASTRVAVVADPHVAARATGTWKAHGRSERILERAVESIRERSVDGLVVVGDLTKDGEPWNYRRYDELTAPVEAPTVTIPGNHDTRKTFDDHDAPTLDAFAERYAPDGYPVHQRIGGVDVIGLASAADRKGSLQDTWGGRVSRRQLSALEDLLDDIETPLVTLHHNLYGLPDLPNGRWENFPVDNGDHLHALLANHNVDLVVSGHQHVPALRMRDGIRELMAPATCSYPQAMVELEVGPEGTTVTLCPLSPPDQAAASYHRAVEGTDLSREIAARTRQRLDSSALSADDESA